MPAAVVEVAFHTNAADAMALQDPLFRTAAMKGVEKGYRLHREGRDCAPLKAGPIRSLQLPQGMSEEVDVPFEGYPQYPIELVTTNIACPPTWTCRDGLVHPCTGRPAVQDHDSVRERRHRPGHLAHLGGGCRRGEISPRSALRCVHPQYRTGRSGSACRGGGRCRWLGCPRSCLRILRMGSTRTHDERASETSPALSSLPRPGLS